MTLSTVVAWKLAFGKQAVSSRHRRSDILNIVEMEARPVHLPDDARKGRNDLALGIRPADDAGIIGTGNCLPSGRRRKRRTSRSWLCSRNGKNAT